MATQGHTYSDTQQPLQPNSCSFKKEQPYSEKVDLGCWEMGKEGSCHQKLPLLSSTGSKMPQRKKTKHRSGRSTSK